MSEFRIVVAFLLAGLPAFLGHAGPAPHPARQGESGLILFESNRDGLEEIYVMRPDGTAKTRLTRNRVRDISAVWSPDGGQIALSRGLRNWELFLMDAAGATQERLTRTVQDEINPAWSPDG